MIVPNPPVVIHITQPYGWVSSIVSFLQFLAASALAITTYLVTRKDKKKELSIAALDKSRERKAVWFHKIVVDEALQAIPDFTSRTREKLQDCSRQLFNGRSEGKPQAALDDLLAHSITEFNVEISQLTRSLSSRIKVMDGGLSAKIERIGDNHENIVTLWMQKLLVAEPFEGRESLHNLISTMETEFLQALFEYEFDRIPVTSPF